MENTPKENEPETQPPTKGKEIQALEAGKVAGLESLQTGTVGGGKSAALQSTDNTAIPVFSGTEDPVKLKQKIWMMASFMAPLGMTKRVSREECYPAAVAAVELAQKAFRAGNLARARELCEEGYSQVAKCIHCMPKIARKVIAPHFKKIAKY